MFCRTHVVDVCVCVPSLFPFLQVSLPTQYNNRNQDPVGALSSALARLQSNKPLRELREVAKGITKQMPQPIQVCSRLHSST